MSKKKKKEFKIGDVVRIKTDERFSNIHKGKQGEIVDLSVDTIYDFWVAVDMPFNPDPIPFFKKEVEHV